MNTKCFPAGAAYHVKIAESIELGALLGRQPRSEKPQAPHLGACPFDERFCTACGGPAHELFPLSATAAPLYPPTRRRKKRTSSAVGSKDFTRRDSPADVCSAATNPPSKHKPSSGNNSDGAAGQLLNEIADPRVAVGNEYLCKLKHNGASQNYRADKSYLFRVADGNEKTQDGECAKTLEHGYDRSLGLRDQKRPGVKVR